MPLWLEIVIACILMLPGLAGTLIPALPGIPIMFIVALAFAALHSFSLLTPTELLILSLLVVLSLVVDYSTGLVGAKMGGASRKSVGWGLAALVIGTVIAPPFGGILAMFLTILAIEFNKSRSQRAALRAAGGSLLGALAGSVINFCLGIAFLILFVLFSQT